MPQNIVAGVSALISCLPAQQRFNPSDLLLPVDSLHAIYPLSLTLAALHSHASVALNSVAGPGSDLDLTTRTVAPTIIVASAETISRYHAKVKAQTNDGFYAIWHWFQARALAAGRMSNGSFINKPVVGPAGPSIATSPGKLRLVFVSEGAQSDSPPLTSSDLSDLRIFTGARFIYALTASRVAGAVASTNLYDYRRDEDGGGDGIDGAAGTRRKCSHFGVPMSCLEIRLLDTPQYKTMDQGCPKGEVSPKLPLSHFVCASYLSQ